MKKWVINTLAIAGTVALTTAIVAPVTWAATKDNTVIADTSSSTEYVSVADMFKASKLYETSDEATRNKLLNSYEGMYVIQGSKLWKQYNHTFNPKGGS